MERTERICDELRIAQTGRGYAAEMNVLWAILRHNIVSQSEAAHH